MLRIRNLVRQQYIPRYGPCVKRFNANRALQAVLDGGVLRPWPGEGVPGHPISDSYGHDMALAVQASGSSEAVIAGEGRIAGVPVAVLAWEFGYLGGSMGMATSALVVAAIRRAARTGLPLVAITRSGGTRMQEGAPAFVQMVAIAAALHDHRAAGLPYLVHLGDPTFGGVLATLGTAGDITTAEPGARIGFLGPRASEAISGARLPAHVQSAEHLFECGLLDGALAWDQVRERWRVLLRLWADRPGPPDRSAGCEPPTPPRADLTGAPASAVELWQNVRLSRSPGRIDARQLVATHLSDWVPLPNSGQGDPGDGALVGVGRLGGDPVVVVATVDRSTGSPLTVGSLRTIRRGIALAGRWGIGLVTVVDTLGAQLSEDSEESGMAGEISRVMLDLVSAPVSTCALLLGAGTGGAALALLATDRIVAGSRTWVAPLAPEGAAAVRRGAAGDPARVAWDQRIGAHALAQLGFVDRVVDEAEPAWAGVAADEVAAQLRDVLAGQDPRRRFERYEAWQT